ncbi:helix-turn-helix domain-containing protein [Halomonas ramblicola]|uniref:helix-turn-helix domain-containing protein n=1 Tax=Halomonas ramblicola TaxID=747349 RepID=UPI0025B4EE82|nr:AraC family transcriptional regulator [Halomonas ramblicola]MDN3519976.1 AraC family transcriptional regulator [Halomonas ramblicola]
MDGEATGLDSEALRGLLAEYPDAPLIVFLPPCPGTRRPRALKATLATLHGLLGAASHGPASAPERHLPRDQAPAKGANGGLAGWQVRRLNAYIDEHLSGPLHVQDLAAITRLSPGHFAHAFKQAFGEPPLVHITRRRLARACEKMLAGDESLSCIAQACGFCDQSHFTRHFHRAMGMAPQRWRRLHALGPQ